MRSAVGKETGWEVVECSTGEEKEGGGRSRGHELDLYCAGQVSDRWSGVEWSEVGVVADGVGRARWMSCPGYSSFNPRPGIWQGRLTKHLLFGHVPPPYLYNSRRGIGRSLMN